MLRLSLRSFAAAHANVEDGGVEAWEYGSTLTSSPCVFARRTRSDEAISISPIAGRMTLGCPSPPVHARIMLSQSLPRTLLPRNQWHCWAEGAKLGDPTHQASVLLDSMAEESDFLTRMPGACVGSAGSTNSRRGRRPGHSTRTDPHSARSRDPPVAWWQDVHSTWRTVLQ
jgi:hypothetical protein